MRESVRPWGGLKKCDYCGCPAMYEFGTRDMPGLSCDAHWDVARVEYMEDGGRVGAIWGHWLDWWEGMWWRRYQRWLVSNWSRRGLS